MTATLRKGLISAWMMKERGGLILADASGNGKYGDLTNMEANDWGMSPIGPYLDFDGSNEYVVIPNEAFYDSFLERTKPFSMFAHIYSTGTGTTERIIMGKMDGSNVGTYMSINETTHGKLLVQLINTSGGTNQIKKRLDTVLEDSTWYHVGFTYSGSSTAAGVKIYVNGVEDTNTTATFDTLSASILNNNVFQIGAIAAGSTVFQGRIASAMVWQRALNPYEVRRLYINVASGFAYRNPAFIGGKVPAAGSSSGMLLMFH